MSHGRVQSTGGVLDSLGLFLFMYRFSCCAESHRAGGRVFGRQRRVSSSFSGMGISLGTIFYFRVFCFGGRDHSDPAFLFSSVSRGGGVGVRGGGVEIARPGKPPRRRGGGKAV